MGEKKELHENEDKVLYQCSKPYNNLWTQCTHV